MTQYEKKDVLVQLGLSAEDAQWHLENEETDIRAVLPTYRLLKPLNDNLKFYQGEYRKLIEKRMEDGTLSKMPQVARLIEAGASPEDIENFAYEMIFSAYEKLLYRLDDHEGAEGMDYELADTYNKCGYGKLMEMGDNGEPTGRYLVEVHGRLPFANN